MDAGRGEDFGVAQTETVSVRDSNYFTNDVGRSGVQTPDSTGQGESGWVPDDCEGGDYGGPGPVGCESTGCEHVGTTGSVIGDPTSDSSIVSVYVRCSMGSDSVDARRGSPRNSSARSAACSAKARNVVHLPPINE